MTMSCTDDVAARKHAIAAVLAIGSEQVSAGKPFFAALVRIEHGDEQVRFIVSAGACTLKS